MNTPKVEFRLYIIRLIIYTMVMLGIGFFIGVLWTINTLKSEPNALEIIIDNKSNNNQND